MLRGPLISPTCSIIGFLCSSFAGIDHAQEPCSAMGCRNAWINWVGKMGVSSEVGDSICVFLQAFDIRIGSVCCAFIVVFVALRRVHASRQRLCAELQPTGKTSKASKRKGNLFYYSNTCFWGSWVSVDDKLAENPCNSVGVTHVYYMKIQRNFRPTERRLHRSDYNELDSSVISWVSSII